MKTFLAKCDSPTYGLKRGTKYNVKKTIFGDYILFSKRTNTPNILFTEKKLKSYGTLLD